MTNVKNNDSKKIIHPLIKLLAIIFFILISILILILLFIFVIGYPKISKFKIKKYFNEYNSEFSLNLPNSFKTIYTHQSQAIDGYEYLMVVKVDEDYKLEYNVQCESTLHENFDIIEHFNKASDNTDKLRELAKTLSSNYDWYAYEEKKEIRTYNLFVVRDMETNYLYVFYICTQISDCF